MTPWVTRLLLANVLVFALQMLRPELTRAFAFVPTLFFDQPWTILTYMFLHGGVSHILFNMLALYFFGPRLEVEIGSRNFLWLYFVSGFMGAALSFLTPYAAIIGASGAVYGVMLGFAYFWPTDKIYIYAILPVQARTLVIVMTALSLYGGFSGGDGVAHFAHLGGFLGGFLYLRWMRRLRGAPSLQDIVPPSIRIDTSRWKNIRREDLHEVNRAEYDRIMEKLERNGVGSLTENEVAFMDRFSPS